MAVQCPADDITGFEAVPMPAGARVFERAQTAHALLVLPKEEQCFHVNNNGSELKERVQRRRKSRAELPRIAEEHLPALRRVLGVKDGDGDFPCPLHNDGVAYLDTFAGDYMLVCDCLGAVLRWGGGFAEYRYALSDAYFAVKTGTVLQRGFRTPYRGAYRLLLHAELGLIEPISVQMPEMPVLDVPNLNRALHGRATEAAALFGDLYAAQLGAGLPRPGAFAVGLVAQWLGCARSQAHAAIRELLAAGVLVRDGEEGKTHCYRPGPGPCGGA